MTGWIKRNRLDLLIVVGAITAFVAVAAYQIELPGLNYDEAMPIVPTMQLLLGQPVDALAAANVFGRSVPLVLMEYVGAISGLLGLPVFALWGPNLISLRVYEIILSVLILVLVYLFGREFVNRRVAALTLSLMAITPSFVFWGRVSMIALLPVLLFGVGALLCLYRWYRGRGAGYFYVGACLLGLGLTTYMTFVWYIAALLLAQGVLEGRVWFLDLRSWIPKRWPIPTVGSTTLAPKSLILGGLAFILGAAPLIWYNLITQGTLRLVMRSAIKTELYGTNNLDFLNNFKYALYNFRQLLDGSEFIFQAGYAYANPLSNLVFVLAVSYLIVQGLRGQLAPLISTRKVTFLVIMVGAILVQSSFTVTGFNIIHILLLFPFPQMLIAMALLNAQVSITNSKIPFLDSGRWSFFIRYAPCAIALALIAFDLVVDVQYHQAFARTGGVGAYSNAINQLAAWLEEEQIAKPLAVDWGFERNIQLLTQGRINPHDIFNYRHDPGDKFKEGLKVRFRDPNQRYLFHTPEFTHFRGHFDAFIQAATESHKVPILEKTFSQRDGRPIYQVYRVEEAPRSFQVPPIQQRRNAIFGDRITLLGFDVARSTFNVQLTLYWQMTGPATPTTSFTVFVHLISPDGKMWAQVDHPPVYGSYPTTRWQPGEVITDPYTLMLPADLPPGTYQVRVGLYDPTTGQRLAIQDPQNDAEGNSLMLTWIQTFDTSHGPGYNDTHSGDN